MLAEDDANTTRAGIIVFALIPFLFLILLQPFKYCLRKQKEKGQLRGLGLGCYNCCIQTGENKEEFENHFCHIPYDISNMGNKDYMYCNPITQAKALLEVFEKELADGII